MPTYLALLAVLWLHGSPPRAAAPGAQQGHIGAWTLKTDRDPFANRLSCRLSARLIEYGRGVLIFHLPKTIDTSAAVYRVDGGEPVDIRSEQMEMARRGLALDEDSLVNPSGGLVRVPQARALSGHTVQIEAAAKGKIFSFHIDGFGAALAAAQKAGCTPDDFSIRNTP